MADEPPRKYPSVLRHLGINDFEDNAREVRAKKARLKAEQDQANAVTQKLMATFSEQLAVLKALDEQQKKDAATAAVTPAAPPKKDGLGNPVVRAVNAAGNAVVDAVQQLDQLFAANPPDP